VAILWIKNRERARSGRLCMDSAPVASLAGISPCAPDDDVGCRPTVRQIQQYVVAGINAGLLRLSRSRFSSKSPVFALRTKYRGWRVGTLLWFIG
jgi:hypothetical protein